MATDVFSQLFEGFNISGIAENLINVAIYGSVLIALVVFAFFVFRYWFFKRWIYNYNCLVYSLRHDGAKILRRKGAKKFFNKENVWKFKVKGIKNVIPCPLSNFFVATEKGDMIYLLYKDGELSPLQPPAIDLSENKLKEIRIIPYDLRLWNLNTQEKESQTFINFKQKLLAYLPYIMVVVSLLFFLLIMIQIMNRFTILQGIAGEMRKAAEALQTCRAIVMPS